MACSSERRQVGVRRSDSDAGDPTAGREASIDDIVEQSTSWPGSAWHGASSRSKVSFYGEQRAGGGKTVNDSSWARRARKITAARFSTGRVSRLTFGARDIECMHSNSAPPSPAPCSTLTNN